MTADQLERMRRNALKEGVPFALISLDGVLVLAIAELRRLERGADVIELPPRRQGDVA